MLLPTFFLLAFTCILVADNKLTTKQIFRLMDADGDGFIRLDEYEGFMISFIKIDDGDKGVTLSELEAAYAAKTVLPPGDITKTKIFELADKNVNSRLTFAELLHLYSTLGLDSSDARDKFYRSAEETWSFRFHAADNDKDGNLLLQEFLEYEGFENFP